MRDSVEGAPHSCRSWALCLCFLLFSEVVIWAVVTHSYNVDGIMNLVLVGISHKTAPVEVREKLVIPEPRLKEALVALKSGHGLEEGMILSTCNRVEVLVSTSDIPDGVRQVKNFISDFHQLSEDFLQKFLYDFTRVDAIKHIFRVASSLDSMVLGEPQILGQVKNAFSQAQSAGTAGSVLNQLMSKAFFVAKRVRSETG